MVNVDIFSREDKHGFLMALVWKVQGLFLLKKKKVFYVCCISFLPLITFPLAAF